MAAGEGLSGGPDQAVVPLSYGQRSLWLLHHLAPESPAYNIAAAARLLSPVEPGLLEQALQALADRHAVLRTTFPAIDGEPGRRIVDSYFGSLHREDATGWDAERLRSRLADEAWCPFDLERGPLLRVTLWTGGPGAPRILLVIHHIIADFWSLAILMRELPALYRAAATGEPARLPPPGLAFEEHSRRERQIMEGGRGEELLAFWREELRGLPALELAVDRPRPAVQTYSGDVRRLRLPGELAAALRARSRAQHGTLFMILTAAFQALLSRYSGQEDLAIGTPRAGRAQSSFAGTVGYFVNQVVLRGDLSGNPTFAELLERTKARVQAALAHGDYPLSLLVENLRPERDASRTPLFQVSFVLQKETRGAEGLTAFALGEEGVQVGPEDFRIESLSLPRMPAPFDLVLHVAERQGGLSLALQFNTDLFDGTTAERLLEHFGRLLEGVVADPQQWLSELPLFAPAESAQLLREWNDTGQASPETTLHSEVRRQAERHPERLAVISSEEAVTYGELTRRAGELAQRLVSLGVGPEVPVALYLERSAAAVVAILGVLEAGGAYMPLDSGHPAERLAAMLESAGHPLLVTQRRLAGALTGMARDVCWLDEEGGGAAPDPARRAGPENLAYILHTSGSTGQPKGVCCSHRGVLNLLADFARRQPLAPGSRGSLWTSLSFDVSVYEIFSPLLAGGALHVVPEEVRQDTERFLDWLIEERIESVYVPPFTVIALRERLERMGGGSSLRRLLVGVEPIPEPLLVRIAQLCPGLAVINGYGPTEATICATLYDVDPRRDHFGQPPITPIGRPAAGCRIYLLGRHQELVPLGVPGELCIAGVGLARGYLRRPELTAERFVPDPFAAEAAELGSRLYRTGDLARRRLDGNLEFLGRVDRQVKIRGFRIEPGEAEAALAQHPRVREAVVVAWPPARAAAPPEDIAAQDRRLVAYVVALEPRPSAAELREALRQTLPDYMIPAAFVMLEELPVTPNGKLDRRALPAPRWSGSGSGAPRTPAEKRLAAIWADVLGLPQVGREDNFFELGGHSLLASRVATRASQAFGVRLPLALLFENPRLADLAARIEASTGGAGGDPAQSVPLVACQKEERYPLSFSQERLWFLHRLAPASSMLHVAAAFGLRGDLQAAVLAASFAQVCARQEALRTRFGDADGAPWQEILAPVPVALPLVDLEGASAAESELRRLADDEAARPFDLSAGLPWRVLLLRRNAREHVLVLTVHHLVTDGWSQEVFLDELAEIYDALLQQRPPRLRELPVQYVDYALWQRRLVSDTSLELELAYWRRQLAAASPAPVLPGQRKRAATALRFRGAVHRFELCGEILEALRKIAGAEAASVFMALFAAFVSLLHQYTGEDDLLVGTNVANRNLAQVEGLIGFFVNTIALRVDLSENPTFRELLRRVRQVVLSAFAHQEIPFEKVLAEIQPRRGESHASLINVMFAMPNRGYAALELHGIAVETYELAHHTATTDLMVLMAEDAGRLPGAFVYDRDLFDGEAIARMARHFQGIVASAVAEPDQPVSCLDLGR